MITDALYQVGGTDIRILHNPNEQMVVLQVMPGFRTMGTISTEGLHNGTELMPEFITRFIEWVNDWLETILADIPVEPAEPETSIDDQINELITSLVVEGNRLRLP